MLYGANTFCSEAKQLCFIVKQVGDLSRLAVIIVYLTGYPRSSPLPNYPNKG